MNKKKIKRRRFRLSGFLLILVIIYIIVMAGYYLFSMPVKSIVVKNNNLVKEKTIIKASNIKTNKSIFKTNTLKAKKNIKQLDLINDVRITKSFLGKIVITVEENQILFFDYLDNKIVLSNNKKIDNSKEYVGYPTLVNYVPSDIQKKLVKSLTKVNSDVISMISEIEYNPDSYNDIVIDSERFILRMNDGNTIYINIVNMEKINKYQDIYSSLTTKGVLYLDSSSKNYVFKSYSNNTEVKEEKNEN